MPGRRQRQFADEVGYALEQSAVPAGADSSKRQRTATRLASQFDSELCKQLAQQWSWGLVSAKTVQEIAHSAFRDEKKLLDNVFTQTGRRIARSNTLLKFASVLGGGRLAGRTYCKGLARGTG